MQTVRGPEGERYLVVKASGESSRVRDPRTGEERYVDNDALEPAGGESPLAAAAAGVSPATRCAVTAVRDERSLGLLIELVDRGPLSVVELLDDYDLCESDLHGSLAEFRAAGLIAEETVYGRRGYDVTDAAREAVARLRDGGD